MGTDRHILNIPEIYRMYQDGWSMKALARLLGVTDTTIKARFVRDNLPLERYHNKIDLRRLALLHHQGLNQTEMAKRLQVSRTSVFRALEKLRALYPEHAPQKRLRAQWHAPPNCKPIYIDHRCPHGPHRLGASVGMMPDLSSYKHLYVQNVWA